MTGKAAIRIFTTCNDLDATVAMYTELFGMRLDMIMPADAPRIAVLSDPGVRLEIEAEPCAADAHHPAAKTHSSNQLLISRAGAENAWVQGRAGMHYRDLIPGRLDGRIIASHIRIAEGGPVPDYVHYHNVAFQIIYCRRGWVRVVYEDQGPPFVMHAGDCVLQPPTIRHRVLESSPGLEVIEIGAPAEHETWREHEFDLPTSALRPERDFSGQRFVRHVAADAQWRAFANSDFECRDTAIAKATDGMGSVRILRCIAPSASVAATMRMRIDGGEFLFLYVLDGQLTLCGETADANTLTSDDACVIPACTDFRLSAPTPCAFLEVALPAR
ncbi:MAG: cupin domain-containing protein [Rudaea sp.]